MINRKHVTRRIPVLAAAVTASLASAAYAQTAVSWVGAPGTPLPYVDGTNWSSGLTPSNAANEFLSINNGGIATVSGTQVAEGAYLHLGLEPTQSGQLQISGGTMNLGELRVGGRERVVDINNPPNTIPNGGGSGTVIQTGGAVNVTFTPGGEPPIQSLYIADSGLASGNTAQGLYNISSGTLLSGIADNDAIVVGTGVGASGTFLQSGGTVTSTGFLTVARGGATSSYGMTGGTLNVGTGTTLAQSGNMVLRIGDGEYPTGTFAPTNGTFTQTNGTANVRTDTIVGRNTGTGSLMISGGTTVFTTGYNINVGQNGTGTVVMGTVGGAGPTLNVGQLGPIAAENNSKGISVGLGNNAAQPSVGTFTMNSGTLNLGNATDADFLAVGDGTAATGTFVMNGGNIAVTDLVQVGRNNSPNDNRFTMDNAASSLTSKRVVIGGGTGATSGRGTFTLVNGSYSGNQATNLALGTNVSATPNACVGVLNIQGGTYTLTGTASTDAVLAIGNGFGGNGALNLSGGTLSVETSVGVVDVGRNNAVGSFTLSGTGVLKTTLLRGADQGATFAAAGKTINFNGGTSTVGTLTLGNSGVMTVNGGTHTITTTNLSTGSTLNVNQNLNLPTVNHGTSSVNVGAGATLSIGTDTTASAARTVTKGGVGTYTVTGTQTHFAGSTLLVTAGTVNENSNPNGLNINSAATTNLNATVSRIGTLTVTGGITRQAAGLTNVVNATVVNVTTGKLDVNNGKLITSTAAGTATGGIYTGVQGMIQTAYTGGTWTGNGITSSPAGASNGLTSLGVSTGAQKLGLAPAATGTFAGQTVTGASTLVMYTYGGDANLDGFVSGDDYSAIDFSIATPGANGWANGDFNYDGIISGDDYSVIDFNIVAQGTPFPTGGSAALSGVTAVPEPTSLGLIGLAATAVVGRRRRRGSQA